MRWLVFILLLLGALFCLSYFVPATAEKAGLLWPFATDSKPIFDFVSSFSPAILAGIADLFFLTAIVGLFSEGIPTNWWPVFVIVATIASLLLYTLYFGDRMIVPVLVDVVLLWGVLSQRWSAGVLRMRTLYAASAGMHPLLRIPVPWVFILAYLIGAGLQYLIPLPIHSPAILFISRITGIVLMVVGILIAASCLRIFSRANTTTVPFETASKLVTWGPYQFSRNPMYISLTLMYLGEAGLLVQIWPLLLLPLVVAYINQIVIPIEEARLREAFGDAYEQYCKTVHRWI